MNGKRLNSVGIITKRLDERALIDPMVLRRVRIALEDHWQMCGRGIALKQCSLRKTHWFKANGS